MNQVQLVRRLLGLTDGYLFAHDGEEFKNRRFGDGDLYGYGDGDGSDGYEMYSSVWYYPDSPDNS